MISSAPLSAFDVANTQKVTNLLFVFFNSRTWLCAAHTELFIVEARYEEKAFKVDGGISSEVQGKHREIVCPRDIFIEFIILTRSQIPGEKRDR